MTLLCSRNLTQQPAFGGDDIAFPTFGLRTKARRLRWVNLSEQKWVILAERRGLLRPRDGRPWKLEQHRSVRITRHSYTGIGSRRHVIAALLSAYLNG